MIWNEDTRDYAVGDYELDATLTRLYAGPKDDGLVRRFLSFSLANAEAASISDDPPSRAVGAHDRRLHSLVPSTYRTRLDP